MPRDLSRRYLAQVGRQLSCSRASRAHLLRRGRELVDAFAQENPSAVYDDYISAFGTPRDFADAMLSTLDPAEATSVRVRRTSVLCCLAAAVVALSLSLAGYWGFRWYSAQEVINGDFYVVTYAPVEMSEEEFFQAINAINEG